MAGRILSQTLDQDFRRDQGVAGSQESFPITFGEVLQAKTNPNFVIHIVTEALSRSPKMRKLTGYQFLAAFKLKPIQYMARPKS